MSSAGITIRNTIESSSGSIIDYEENETKVAIHDEKNLVFPLLSKTFFSTRFKDRIQNMIFTTVKEFLSGRNDFKENFFVH